MLSTLYHLKPFTAGTHRRVVQPFDVTTTTDVNESSNEYKSNQQSTTTTASLTTTTTTTKSSNATRGNFQFIMVELALNPKII